jgi:hypothetical protein
MPSDFLPQLPDSTCNTGPGTVPVYNCVVILSAAAANGRLRGRVANLPEIVAEGNSERDVLIQLTKRFKQIVQECTVRKQEVPWQNPPEQPGLNEQQRFIPVHL